MIIAGVEFKSGYLEYYYKWLKIVELKHNEEVFLLYLKDCFIKHYPKEINIFDGSKIVYTMGYFKIIYNNEEYDSLESLLKYGFQVIQEYEDFRNRNT